MEGERWWDGGGRWVEMEGESWREGDGVRWEMEQMSEEGDRVGRE